MGIGWEADRPQPGPEVAGRPATSSKTFGATIHRHWLPLVLVMFTLSEPKQP